jgi:hypothetical protein
MRIQVIQRAPQAVIIQLACIDIQSVLQNGIAQPLANLVQGARRQEAIERQDHRAGAVTDRFLSWTLFVDDAGDIQGAKDGQDHGQGADPFGQLIVNVRVVLFLKAIRL